MDMRELIFLLVMLRYIAQRWRLETRREDDDWHKTGALIGVISGVILMLCVPVERLMSSFDWLFCQAGTENCLALWAEMIHTYTHWLYLIWYMSIAVSCTLAWLLFKRFFMHVKAAPGL